MCCRNGIHAKRCDQGRSITIIANRAGCEETRPVQFGYDTISTCFVELEAQDVYDCDSLRERLMSLQQPLIAGDWLLASGDRHNSTRHPHRLVPILMSSEENSSCAIEEPLEDDFPLYTCSMLPTEHRLHVLYTETRLPQGPTLRRIVGASLRIESTAWSLNGDELRSKYFLTSSVIFTAVPLEDDSPKSRFWERFMAAEGTAAGWVNIFDVFKDVSTGEEIFELSFSAMTLGSVVLLLGLLHCVLPRHGQRYT